MEHDHAAMIAAEITRDAVNAAEAYFTTKRRADRDSDFMAWGMGIASLPEPVGRCAADIFEQRFSALAALN